jgi:hypothetical protein
VIQPLLQSLKLSLQIGFLDDLILGGHVDMVAADIVKLAEECRRLGLELNPTKCEIVGLSQSDADNVNELRSFRIDNWRTLPCWVHRYSQVVQWIQL